MCKLQSEKSVWKNSHLNLNYWIPPGTTVSQNWQTFLELLSLNAYNSATTIDRLKIPKIADKKIREKFETFVGTTQNFKS